jgi:hypothetical protein
MTENTPNTQENTQTQTSDKELNFRKLEAKYQQELAVERAKREETEKRMQELSQKQAPPEDDEDDSEPYVDHRKLDKKLSRFAAQTKTETQSEIQKAVAHAIREEQKKNYVKSNPDFFDVLEKAEQLAMHAPELAESILEMPESFERQKLVYKNIKALGLDKPKEKQPSIQETIDAKRKSPYYQPSGVGSSPYASAGDFSPSGQKNAYDKMKELQARLRL